MAGSMNRVTLIGNLGQTPEIRSTQSGGKVASMSLATSESWTDKHSGERQERTEWHRIVVWNEGLIGVIEKYCAKGDKVLVEGTLRTRKWVDQNENERYTTEIVLSGFDSQLILLGSPNRAGQQGSERAATPRQRETAGATGGFTPGAGADLDDEIPFAPCVD
ncbi:single-stranded DNA-binding protein [Acidiphilium sp. PA]|uniref:single-stranded DNA-binding protein n=1 Tax=Acidiphilium sp. PA TaxID=2871705 RepID=UPI00224434CF|nr:single-stranded DNA-binding protein [Acidiphilium sp. PA]MCW8309033.1 single-stranded DNA-binding protein [Acidiphilium sp. PA]